MSGTLPVELYSKIHEHMPIVCVDVLVRCNRKYLLIKRALNPLKGKWYFPGGRVMRDEKLRSCAVRVVREEVSITRIKHVYRIDIEEQFFNTDPFKHGNGTHTITFLYSADSPTMRVRVDKNHLLYGWFSAGEMMVRKHDARVRRIGTMLYAEESAIDSI